MRQQGFHLDRYVHKVRYLTRAAALTAVFTVVVGCTRTASSAPRTGVPRSPVPEAGVSDSANLRSSPLFIYQPGELRYRLQVSSTIQLISGDSVNRIDSTRVTGNLNVRFSSVAGRDQVTVEVQSDSALLTVAGGTSVPMVSGPPFVFVIDPRNSRITATEVTQNPPCIRESNQQSPFSGREVLPNIQPQFRSTWADTTTTTTCRDGVLLFLTRVASYARLQSPDSTYRFLRSTQVAVTGSGVQWEQRVNVSGKGSATDTLYLSGLPTRLRESSGSSHLQLQFRTPLKTQEFIQNTTTHVLLQH